MNKIINIKRELGNINIMTLNTYIKTFQKSISKQSKITRKNNSNTNKSIQNI